MWLRLRRWRILLGLHLGLRWHECLLLSLHSVASKVNQLPHAPRGTGASIWRHGVGGRRTLPVCARHYTVTTEGKAGLPHGLGGDCSLKRRGP